MALLTLFTQSKAKLDVLELDCSVSETHEAAATLSQSEIEDGSTINDNVILLPRRLTIEGVVSSTPLGLAGLVGAAASTAAGVAASKSSSLLQKGLITAAGGTLGGLVSHALGFSRDPADVYKFLVKLRDARQPFNVVTALTKYSNMILTNLSVPRSIQTVNVLRFTATMEEAKLVTSQVINLSSVPGAGQAANLGKQAAGAASTATQSNASWAYQGLQAAGVPLP